MRWFALLAFAAVVGSGCISVQGEATATYAPELQEALLWSSHYPTVVVEVGAVQGREPDPSALIALGLALVELTGRPEADVNILQPRTIPAQGGDYKPSDLARIHRATASVIDPDGHAVGTTATLHVLFLDGRVAAGEKAKTTLGSTLASEGLIAVFPDEYANAIRLTPTGQTASAKAEMDRHVLLHELGHAFGLVGQRIPMVRPHVDADHPGHSSNPVSIMHHRPPMTVEGFVYGDRPRDFDADDRADLAAFRASAP
ncbi:MAG: hypothetical protein QOJ26_292 [Thermoplasmata archaeon]|nr:hypothetical protein [Thermoplasmata archaeon]MEA3165440.1 hypothetical protein [Thermoplasmata archaeon]